MVQLLLFSCLLVVSLITTSIGTFQKTDWTNVKVLRRSKVPDSRIIGGGEVEPHSVPFQVGLWINHRNAFCSGSLISENYVLTAGHCGIAITSIVEVLLGAHNLTADEPSQVTIVGSDVLIHPDYDDATLLNDLTLIKLETPAPINEFIQAAKLPALSDSGKVYDIDATAVATGWGLVYDVRYPSTHDLSPVLQSVELSVLNTTVCKDFYVNHTPDVYDGDVSNKSVCTSGYKNKGTCDGDSGGPLSLDGVVIGITSFGTNQCELCSPSVYTKINDYLDWIQENSDVVLNK